jgi:hypothetical protein
MEPSIRSLYRCRNDLDMVIEEDRYNFVHLWSSIQERFDEDATRAVLYADMLLSDLVQEYSGRMKPVGPEERRLEVRYPRHTQLPFV